ncbi:hypothetical protein VTK26DRAFT_4953 [Humicola hyalothermophila]
MAVSVRRRPSYCRMQGGKCEVKNVHGLWREARVFRFVEAVTLYSAVPARCGAWKRERSPRAGLISPRLRVGQFINKPEPSITYLST